MNEFFKTMKTRAKAWLRQNVSILLAIADICMPSIAILVSMKIEGSKGIAISLTICLIFQCMLGVLRHFYAWLKERTDMPKPNKRFTRDEGDGEVTIEYSRLQELILFMNEYEDWLEANNLMEVKNDG